jgi:single-stranded-DNA-specific exonuclease
VNQCKIVGEGHVSCIVSGPAGGRVKAIAFRSAATALGRELADGRVPLRLAGRIRLDKWQGREQVCFEIDDAAPMG